jgi:Ti-type conjugative transfer relaxase TraA
MALYHVHIKVLSRANRNTVAALAYRSGIQLIDERTGEGFNFRNKSVEHVELLLPEMAPQWAKDLQILVEKNREKGVQKLSTIVETAEKRIDAQIYKDFEFALPAELTIEQNKSLMREFIQDQFCKRGITVLANVHNDYDNESGQKKPHCHAVLLTRELTETGLSKYKNRDWNQTALLEEWREQLAAYTNFHLQLHGHQARIDHRSYVEQGIEIEPQPKLSRSVQEMEGRLGNNAQDLKPEQYTDKAKEYQHIKLKNLYRIMKNPEVVFDIIHKSQATFMEGDIDKVLAQYIDDPQVFQACQAKLINSAELRLLRETEQGAVYTTRGMMKRELSLINLAQTLSQTEGHEVSDQIIQNHIALYDKKYEKSGGLSSDQKRALNHLIQDKNLVTIVGYAGTGKSSILSCAQDIWQENGYAVYGLAPTGKAAQNLQNDGIQSMTLHKFLRQYHQGRSQFKRNSVLILDEAGMVDITRFEELLAASQKLGIKLVTVGDGKQLQPIEAGAAFRLVTKETGVATLETVIRQKQVWMKEATRDFGRGETEKALGAYLEKGRVVLIDEPIPDIRQLDTSRDYAGLVEAFNIAVRSQKLAGWTFRSDIELTSSERGIGSSQIKLWKAVEKEAAQVIAANIDLCRPYITSYKTDPLRIAQNLNSDKSWAEKIASEWAIDRGSTKEGEFICNPRQATMTALLQDWHQSVLGEPKENHVLMAYTLKETELLNQQARLLRFQDGAVEKQSFTHHITRIDTDDFGDEVRTHKQRQFSKGDRLLFMKNDQGLGVRNGMVGTIEEINKTTLKVRLDAKEGEEGKTVSFASKLYPYVDLGWAININKQQGATNHKSFILASNHFHSNLSYVALTRHKEEAYIYGTSQEFWTGSVFVKQLGKGQEKLSSLDYIDADKALKMVRQDSSIITQSLERVSNQLKAIHYTAKRGLTRWLGKEPTFDKIEVKEALTEAQRAHRLQSETSKDLSPVPTYSYSTPIEELSKAQADRQMCQATGRSLHDFETTLTQFIKTHEARSVENLTLQNTQTLTLSHAARLMPTIETTETNAFDKALERLKNKYGDINSAGNNSFATSVNLTVKEEAELFYQKYHTYQKALEEKTLTDEQKNEFKNNVIEFSKKTSAMTYVTLTNFEVRQEIDRLITQKDQDKQPIINKGLDLSR